LVARKESSVGEVPVLRELHLHDPRHARTRLPMSRDRGVGNQPLPASPVVADANGEGLQGAVLEHPGERLPRSCSRARRDEEQDVSEAAAGWWQAEPRVGRVAHGVPNRVDRLRCLGNAIVPQVAEVIGRAIIELDAAQCR
jgi:site-specific DNA-cytosine methylase